MVIVTFIWKPPDADAVEITVNQLKVKIKRLNPFTFRFEAPANPAGKYPLQVTQNKRSLGQELLVYGSSVGVTDMDFLVQSLGVSLSDRAGIDQALLQRLECSLPVEELHLLFRDLASSHKDLNPQRQQMMYRLRQAKRNRRICQAWTQDGRIYAGKTHDVGTQSDKELPTMLHVAAQYGLREFGSRLAELPGAILAFQTKNCHGDDPVAMAEKAGHTELADYLSSYFETQETVGVIDDIYTSMYGESLRYMNSSSGTHTPTNYANQVWLPDATDDTVHVLAESDDDDDNDYISVDSYLPGRARDLVPEILTKAKIPPPEPAAKDRSATTAALSNAVVLGVAKIPPPESPSKDRSATTAALSKAVVLGVGQSGVLNPGALGSRGLNELIQINTLVKDSRISVNNAQRFFRAWQQRYGEGSKSFKERQVTLGKLRANFATTMKTVNIQRHHSYENPEGLVSGVINSKQQDQMASRVAQSPENQLSNTTNPAGKYPLQVTQNKRSLGQEFLVYGSSAGVTDMDSLVHSLGVSLSDRAGMDQAFLQRLECSLPVEELHLDLASSHKDLNPQRQQMMYRLRQAKRNRRICQAWTQDGRIYAGKTHDVGTQSDKELPTMLHVAAQYGLREFGSRLAELPGAILAFQTKNCHGDDPVAMAEKAGHTELADYLSSYFETQETVGVIDDIYTSMYGKSLRYMNGSSGTHTATNYDNQASLSDDTVHVLAENSVSDDDDDNDYISVDSYLPDPAQDLVPEILTKAKIPPPESPAKDRSATTTALSYAVVLGAGSSGVMNPGAMGSRGLNELIEINNMVKDSKISVNNAQKFFTAWQQRYGEGSKSFEERQVTLGKLRANFATTMKTVNIQRHHSYENPEGLVSDVINSKQQDQMASSVAQSPENRLSNTSSSSSGSAGLLSASGSSESLGRFPSQSPPHKSQQYSPKNIPSIIPPPIPKRRPISNANDPKHNTLPRH